MGMVLSVDGCGYYRYLWACACYKQGFFFLNIFQSWSALLEWVGFFVYIFLNLKYTIFLWYLMFHLIHIAAKGISPGDNKVVCLHFVLIHGDWNLFVTVRREPPVCSSEWHEVCHCLLMICSTFWLVSLLLLQDYWCFCRPSAVWRVRLVGFSFRKVISISKSGL